MTLRIINPCCINEVRVSHSCKLPAGSFAAGEDSARQALSADTIWALNGDLKVIHSKGDGRHGAKISRLMPLLNVSL